MLIYILSEAFKSQWQSGVAWQTMWPTDPKSYSLALTEKVCQSLVYILIFLLTLTHWKTLLPWKEKRKCNSTLLWQDKRVIAFQLWLQTQLKRLGPAGSQGSQLQGIWLELSLLPSRPKFPHLQNKKISVSLAFHYHCDAGGGLVNLSLLVGFANFSHLQALQSEHLCACVSVHLSYYLLE